MSFGIISPQLVVSNRLLEQVTSKHYNEFRIQRIGTAERKFVPF
jgi:hypothetical protein